MTGFAALLASAVGCQAPAARFPRTAAEALALDMHRLALELVHDQPEALQREVARAIVAEADPEMSVELVGDNELAARVGAHAARKIRQLGLVLRVVTTCRTPECRLGTLEGHAGVRLAGPSGRLSGHGTSGSDLSKLTGERYPTATSTTAWETHSLPPFEWKFPPLSPAEMVQPVLTLAIFPPRTDARRGGLKSTWRA